MFNLKFFVRCTILCVIFSVLSMGEGHASAFTPEKLMTSIVKKKFRTAKFTETRYISILDAPLKVSGVLHFREPDYLEKHVLLPEEERMIIEGSVLTMQKRDEEKAEVSLDDVPVLKSFIFSIRSVLTGNLAALKKEFTINLIGSERAWTLNLDPKNEETLAVIKRIIVQGRHNTLYSIKTFEEGGDSSVIKINE
ncbi:MAG: LolA-related protein [Alphaproteobacteria bacterium]